MPKPYVQVTLRLRPALAERLEAEGAKHKQGLSTWIAGILEDREEPRKQGEKLGSE